MITTSFTLRGWWLTFGCGFVAWYRSLTGNCVSLSCTKMKKLFFFLLAVLYISSSCEASVYLHYCMGKPVSFSFSPDKTSNCHRCGMKKSGKGMGCCKDEQKIIKSDKSQKVTDLVSADTNQKKFDKIFPAFYTFSVDNYQQLNDICFSTHGPPPGESAVSLYLMNCLFLI